MRNRNLFTLLITLFAGGACDEDSDEGNGDAARCARICARAAAANCRNESNNCEAECANVIATTPERCTAQLDSFAHCAGEARWSCDENGEPTACPGEYTSLVVCVQPGGGSDADSQLPQGDSGASDASALEGDASNSFDSGASDAGTPDGGLPQADSAVADSGTSVPDSGSVSPGCAPIAADDSCTLCLKTSCCSELSACDQNCTNILSCIGTCEDELCFENCFVLFEAGAGHAMPENMNARSCDSA